MAHGPRYRVLRRRRREGRTDYKRRLGLLKSNLPRAVVRRTQKKVMVQFILFDPKGDKVISTTTGSELKKFGWSGSVMNTPAAYLTGFLAGTKAKEAGIHKAVLDIGQITPTKGARIFATLKGMIDAGVEIPHGEEVMPSEERIQGEHINESIKNLFEATKTKLEGGK